ncbi:YbaN family protein [Salinivibrio costicola]|uniref:Inner membrane protein n=1 Tax=Salinivibrio costicola TaxID=51367 RepID=A0ABX6K2G0_SALCS|nr:YbaN family protein [Salinivibrio costicola]QIR05742.1 DUF454 domain-containing protein [Salinivibrio costicola]
MQNSLPSSSPRWRWLWNSLGWLWVGLGTAGIFLPVLPTTPFLLLASGCFMRGSPRIANWLHAHPTFGPILTDWYQKRAISRKVKIRATVMILASFTFSIYIVSFVWLKVMLLICLIVLLCWFLRLPETESVAASAENS